VEKIRSFVAWCLASEKLKPETVRSYLRSIHLANVFKGFNDYSNTKDDIIEMLLTGAANLSLYSQKATSLNRRSVNIHILLVFGHRLATSDWSPYSKAVVWTAALLAFFTCARMGEILPLNNNYDPFATLCWKQIKFLENNEIVIFLPSTKTNSSSGEFVDVFPFELKECCPVAAIKNLRALAIENGFTEDKPVFNFANSKPLTPQCMNKILKNLLFDICQSGTISCHSFRSAVPTVIANFPDKSYVKDINEWGRWNSDCSKIYMKTECNKRRYLFGKISKIILHSANC